MFQQHTLPFKNETIFVFGAIVRLWLQAYSLTLRVKLEIIAISFPNVLIRLSLCLCFNIWQRSMMSCVRMGRILTCCLSSPSWHPLSSLDYHQVEAYRASKRHKMTADVYVCVHLYPVLGNDTMLLVCVTEGTALFLLTINKERHTSPHCQMWEQIPQLSLFTIRWHVIPSLYTVYSPLSSLPTGPRRLLRSPAGFCLQGSMEGL